VADSPDNMQQQTSEESKAKDRAECRNPVRRAQPLRPRGPVGKKINTLHLLRPVALVHIPAQSQQGIDTVYLIRAGRIFMEGKRFVSIAVIAFSSLMTAAQAQTFTKLFSFDRRDGAGSQAGLIQGTGGNFYGTTSGGGANGPYYGTVFEITPSGTLTRLYSFCSESGCTDGSLPDGGLVQAPENEDLYGATFYGGTGCGSNGCGTIFKMTPSGTLTTVFRSYCPESGCPYYPGALLQDTNGAFYGATFDGGTGSVGTAYSLSLGLGAFVKPLPTSGAVGSAVKILGSNLTGATSVTFDGIAATFTVVSRYLITTTVPTGATSGTVEVVTPSAALSSNVAFTVP